VSGENYPKRGDCYSRSAEKNPGAAAGRRRSWQKARQNFKGIVHSDPEIMGGTPVFVGTRVPLQNLIDALEGGESVEDFLEGFPSVQRSQAIAIKNHRLNLF
jgi:uncharacterized protein (DUF433 family)